MNFNEKTYSGKNKTKLTELLKSIESISESNSEYNYFIEKSLSIDNSTNKKQQNDEFLNSDFNENQIDYQNFIGNSHGKENDDYLNKTVSEFNLLKSSNHELKFNNEINEDNNQIDENKIGNITNIENNEIILDMINNGEKEKTKVIIKKIKRDFGNYRSRLRTQINQFYQRILNKAIEISDLPENLKNIKIHKPNHKAFSGRMGSSKVSKELGQSMKDIICGPYIESKNHKKHYEIQANQKENKANIELIENYYKKNPSSKSVKEIIDLINMKYRRFIEIFCDLKELKEYKDFMVFKEFQNLEESKEFTNFKQQEKNKADEQKFKKKYGYSLFEKNGLIKYYLNKENLDKKAGNADGHNDELLGRKRNLKFRKK